MKPKFMIILNCLVFVSLLHFAGQCNAGVSGATILEYGIYSGTPEKSLKNPDAPTGQALWGGSYKLVRETDHIPAQRGITFGIRFSIQGQPEGSKVALRFVHQMPGVKDPETGTIHYKIETSAYYKIGDPAPYMLYEFTEAWEAIPGQWVFQVYNENSKLLEKTFSVIGLEKQEE